jgi:hypothetical protein
LSFDYEGNCYRKCPLECEQTTFDVSIGEVAFDVNVLNMNFFYLDRHYTDISQVAKTSVADLIANTGGVLGLFLELSFLSVYRFLLIGFDLILA